MVVLAAPPFIADNFWGTMHSGPPASQLPTLLEAGGFREAAIVYRGVSYLARAVR